MSLVVRRGLVGLACLFTLTFVVYGLASGFTPDDLLFGPPGVAFVVVGSVLGLRVPENRVSWLALAVGTSMMAMGAAEAVLEPEVAEVVTGAILFGLFVPSLAVLIPLWFPTGRPPTPRWSWVAWSCIAGVGAIFVGQLWKVWIEGGEMSGVDTCTSPGRCVSIAGLGMLLLAVVFALVSLVVRWRRASGVERLQLRWLVPSFIVLAIGMLAEFGGFQDSIVATVGLAVGFLLVPAAIGLSILRYRLYDIDRIISRTVSYVLIIGLLAAVFAAGVVWIPTALGLGDSPLLVAGSTLAVAAIFTPLRRRVQGWVDRRFDRSRYDAERVVEDFAGSLRERIHPDDVVEGWVATVEQTMKPEVVSVWVRET